MKCISPGCVCRTMRSAQVERSSLEYDVDMMEGTSSKWRKKKALHCLFLIQKYCFAITEQTGRQRELGAEVQSFTAERGGVQQDESRMAGLCGFVKGFKVRSSTGSFRNPNSLQLNERPLIHWWNCSAGMLEVMTISMTVRNITWRAIRPLSGGLWCMALALQRSWNDNSVVEALGGFTASYHAQSSSHSVKSAHFCCH